MQHRYARPTVLVSSAPHSHRPAVQTGLHCLAGHPLLRGAAPGLMVGASPDALVWHPASSEWCPQEGGGRWVPDPSGRSEGLGKLEVVEIKNRCPFAVAR